MCNNVRASGCKNHYPLTGVTQRSVFAHLGYSSSTGYNGWYNVDLTEAQYIHMELPLLDAGPRSCSATNVNVQRFCSCSVVESGWYQDQGEAVWYNCPVNSGHTITGQAITGCRCNAGYTGANPCAQCEWQENTRTLLDLPCAQTAVPTRTLQLRSIQWRLPVWHVRRTHSL